MGLIASIFHFVSYSLIYIFTQNALQLVEWGEHILSYSIQLQEKKVTAFLFATYELSNRIQHAAKPVLQASWLSGTFLDDLCFTQRGL